MLLESRAACCLKSVFMKLTTTHSYIEENNKCMTIIICAIYNTNFFIYKKYHITIIIGR